jgi:hypothetical protein
MKTKKSKTWKFPVSAKIMDNGKVVYTAMLQLYQIGVYVCAGSPGAVPNQQLNLTPAQAIKFFKQFEQSNLKGENVTSEFGPVISVTTDTDGFYVRAE